MQQQGEYQVVERIPTVEEYLALREAARTGRGGLACQSQSAGARAYPVAVLATPFARVATG